jgi:signal transduction histidine kinase
MKPGKTSLLSRFALTTALMATTIVLLAALFFHYFRGDLFQGSFSAPLDEWASSMAAMIAQNPEKAADVARNHQLGVIFHTEDGVMAYGPDGNTIAPETLMKHAVGFRQIQVNGHDHNSFTFYLDRDQFTEPRYSLIGIFLALLLFTMGFVYYVQLSQLKPLRWLGAGVDSVSKGDFSTRVPVVRNDEIGQVGRAFNNMTERVEQMINDHDRLMADVSHELRSPMARIKVALELMPESKMREEIARDVREMEALTTVLLERERVRNRTDRMDKEPVDLALLMSEVVEGFAGRAPGVKFLNPPDSLVIEGDAPLIKVLAQNLIDNALKFSLEDSKPVQLSLQKGPEDVLLKIEDNGPGIPAEEAERVMEPFVKLDPSRGHRAGYGLGLNLCQRIVQAHDGDISILPALHRGTIVQVRLPVAPTVVTRSYI